MDKDSKRADGVAMNARSFYRETYIQPEWLNTWSEKEKGPNGKCFCKFCRKEVPPGRRRYWCSQECIDELNRQSGSPRQLAYKRDGGVCAHCGLDCEKLERVHDYLKYRAKKTWYHWEIEREIKTARPKWLDAFRAKYPWAKRHTWEADHERPVIEGGSEEGKEMANIRTLCIPCHRQETRKLHRRLANKRAGRQTLPGLE